MLHVASLVLGCHRFGLPQEPNIRYLALENLTRLALVPEVLESIREHQVHVAANSADLGGWGKRWCAGCHCVAHAMLHVMHGSLLLHLLLYCTSQHPWFRLTLQSFSR